MLIDWDHYEAKLRDKLPPSKEIEPALSPEQWRIVEAEKGFATQERARLIGEVGPFGRIAIYNAALPDDDPRKITRADVRDLLCDAEFLSGSENDSVDADVARHLRVLAAKLAALCPPE